MEEVKLLKGLLKNLTKLTLGVLVTFLITGTIGYGANEAIWLKDLSLLTNNNAIEVIGNNDFVSSSDLDILNIGQNDLSKLWGIKKIEGTGNIDIKNIKINISTGDNIIPTEVKGIWLKSGTFTANDVNLTLNNNTTSSTWGIEKTNGTFTANDINMNINAKTGEIYGIFNTGTSNDPSNFSARNIKIVANNENGDFIGITNKWGNSNFSANNISIDATAKGFMVGIENQTTNELKNLNDVGIKLNGTGSITGISNQKSNLSANNILLSLTNSSKDGRTVGIDVASKTLATKNDLSIEILGEARNITGVKGNSVINGNVYLNMQGGTQDAYGFSGLTTLNGKNNIININSSKSAGWVSALFGTSIFGNDSTTSIKINATDHTNLTYATGTYGSKLELGENSILNIEIDGTGSTIEETAPKYQGGISGILIHGNANLKEGSKTYVKVQGAGVNENGYLGTVGIGGNITASGDVRVDVLSENGIGLRAASRGEKQIYTGNTIVNAQNGYAIATVDFESSPGGLSEVKINPEAEKTVQLTGDLKHFTTSSSLIDISLKTQNSFFTGASLGVDNENNKKTNLSLENEASWNVTGKSTVSSLNLKNKGLVNFDRNKSSIDIKNLQGDQTGIFSLNVSSVNKADGNMIYVQESNGGEYQVSLQNSNLEDIKIGDKIRFATTGTDAKFNNLSFKVTDIKERGIKDVSFKVEKSDYDLRDDQNEIYNGQVADENKLGNDYVNNNYGDGENWYLSRNEKEEVNDIGVTILEAAKSNYANAVFMDNLNKRLGDMSFANGSDGLWVRVRNDRVGEGDQYRLSNYTTQLGYDKLHLVEDGIEHRGVAFEYSKGDLDYKDLRGNSDTDKYLVTLYKTRLRDNKVYTDYTLRGGALANDFTVYGRETGAKVVGKFKNMLLGAGGEVGKKFNFSKNWYFEPQAQLQYTYINSTDYTTNQMTKVDLDEIHSLIGRAGIRIGQDFYSNNLKNSTIYIKVDINHEFLGKQNIEATDVTGSLNETYRNNETWYDLGIGVTKVFTSNLNGYMDMEQQFGSNKDNKSWQANIGFRYKF